MTIDEAATKWGVKSKTVSDYIGKNRIPYEIKDKKVIIDDDLPKPFVLKKSVILNANKIRAYIIKATFLEQYIGECSFLGKIRKGSFSSYIDELEKDGLLYMNSSWENNKSNIGYNVSQKAKSKIKALLTLENIIKIDSLFKLM